MGIMYKDKEKQKQWFREWHLRNKQHRVALAKEQRTKTTLWFKHFKATLKCKLCPESFPACLDFHHRDPSTKKFNVSSMMSRGRKAVLEEIEKCDVLCANCHRKLENGGLV